MDTNEKPPSLSHWRSPFYRRRILFIYTHSSTIQRIYKNLTKKQLKTTSIKKRTVAGKQTFFNLKIAQNRGRCKKKLLFNYSYAKLNKMQTHLRTLILLFTRKKIKFNKNNNKNKSETNYLNIQFTITKLNFSTKIFKTSTYKLNKTKNHNYHIMIIFFSQPAVL